MYLFISKIKVKVYILDKMKYIKYQYIEMKKLI